MFVMEDPADDILQETAPVLSLATRFHPELESESDVGLVTYMAFRDAIEDRELALNACEELHRRHAHFIVAWCIRNHAETFGESAEAFVNLTFWKAFNEAETFSCADGLDGPKMVKAWLFRILKNLYLDSLRSEKRRPVDRNQDGLPGWLEDIEDMRREMADAVPTGDKAAILAFMETLPPKDRAILTVTAEFWDPRKGEVVIDDEIRLGLCAEFGMTDSSLRVKRKRLKDRAKDFIENYRKTNN